VAGRAVPCVAGGASVEERAGLVPSIGIPWGRPDNASRAALEVALLDGALRHEGSSAGRLLPPRREKVCYSGVITAGAAEKALLHARQMRLLRLPHVKLKVGFEDDVERIRAVRTALGDGISLRL